MLEVSPLSAVAVRKPHDDSQGLLVAAAGEERRKYPRYKVTGLACSVYMLGIESHAMICDMSLEGANILLPSQKAPVTCSMVISMRLPGAGIAVAEALIRSFARLPTGYSLHVALEFPEVLHCERVRQFLAALS